MSNPPRKFSIKQIAAQAGVSKATVDRALHQRGYVHYQTQKRIQQAIQELEALDRAGLASGRTLHIDVIMHSPGRFSQAVQSAILAEIGNMAPFRFSPRFHLFESIDSEQLCQLMQRCLGSGSQGIILKASDDPRLVAEINQVTQAGLPVVTLATDIPQSQRVSYVGIDNQVAGQTAAYLFSQWLGHESQPIAIVLSSNRFRGEGEREIGFRQWLRSRAPHFRILEVSGSYGVYQPTHVRMLDVLDREPDLRAVYSVGGGNQAIVDAFADRQRSLQVFIGHDLDQENRRLLLDEHLHAVINHDLRMDARHCFIHILAYHRLWQTDSIPASPIQIITPFSGHL